MKLNLVCGAVLVAMFSASAGAQTCAAPDTTWHPDTLGNPSLSGSTCSHETGIVSLCEGAQDAHQNAYVAQITPAAPGNFSSITVSGVAGFTAYLAVVDATATGACNSTASGDTGHCVESGDAATPLVRSGVLVDGHTYYVIVSNSGVADTTASCGAFTLTSDGSFPVTLQNFSVI